MEYKDNVIDYLDFVKEMKSKGLISSVADQDSKVWNNLVIDVKYLKELYNFYSPNMCFLELGCGVGNVLRFANNIGYLTMGFEIDSNLTKGLKNPNIINFDIRKLPDFEYKNSDIIYCYRPIKEGYDEYIEKVISVMKSGAILMTPMTFHKNENLKMVGLFMYKKI